MSNKIDKKLMLATIRDWGKVLLLMLDEAVAILVILLILHFVGIQITLAIKIGAGITFFVFIFIRHVAVIPSFHRKIVTGREGMIGEQGQVVNPLTPLGVIIVKGEYWRAKSVDDNIEVNDSVEIVGLEELTLIVKRKVC